MDEMGINVELEACRGLLGQLHLDREREGQISLTMSEVTPSRKHN